ncbi:SDR family NAD(P)-dependent oxidoreductase [Methylosinus trichosporium]|uniref:SDR family NAD(P)-dependent oxidoreductase n=1 Tax=Methylosinus trichosporium TaxID=426 RepID=UPI0024BA1D1F|nr:SDR family NAD(P)-dependent oxidoreductase [Methylosinus trichosporium]
MRDPRRPRRATAPHARRRGRSTLPFRGRVGRRSRTGWGRTARTRRRPHPLPPAFGGRPPPRGGGGRASSSAPAPVAETDIAVIGLSCRFPGAPDADAFWDNLLAGRCAVGAAPAGRWDGAEAETLRRGGFLDDHDIFDPEFFNLSWREAEAMSPQQRIFLEEAWNALENAGYGRRSLAGRRCAIFVGVAPDGYGVCDNDSLSSLGGSAAILSARLSYLLDLKGPSLPVDTACSSSLVAVHLACRALLADDCEMALAGGVSVLMNEPRLHAFLDDAGMLSPTGLCRAFDASADGFAPGEGCGVLALKKLGAAIADGDHIVAVIKATGINQDGRSSGITAPSGAAQTELERAVLARAGVGAERIGLVEAHGTGTQLGDPIEVAALTATFRAATEQRGFCALGSVKTNIGHTLAAAGVAGLIKAMLAVRAGVIPPSLHFARANPEIDFDSGPFFVPRAAQVWEASPRFAAVSSFGFSGTNAHAIIGEAPSLPVAAEAPGRALILLSARSEEALAARRRDLADWLDTHRARLADLAFTLAHGRSHFEHRQALVAASLEEVAQWLRREEAGAAIALPARAESAELATLLAAPVRDLDCIAACYLRGGDGDWSLLAAPGARRLALPGYPFARIRFPTRRLPSGFAQPAPARHPLLTPGPPGDAMRLAIHAEDGRLEAHRFGGAALLPAATLIEIIRAAGSRALGRPVGRLSKLRFEAPLRAGAQAAIRFERDGAFALHAPDGTLHAKGFVAAADQSEPEGSQSDARPQLRAFRLASRGEEEGRRFTRQAVYAAFAELGFDYGPSLRVIRSLRADAQEAFAELEPQEPCDPALMLDPALLDGAIQAAIGTMMADAVSLRAVLPVGVDEIVIHAPLQGRCCAHVAMRRTGEDSRSLDILLVDPDGRALVELRGVALRIAVATTTDRECLAFAPVWEPRPLAPAEPPRALLLFDRDEALWRRLGDAAILVRPGAGFCRLEERCFAIDPASAEDYRRLVDLLRSEGRLPAAVWHLWSHHSQPLELRGLGAEAVAADLRLGLVSVALLAAALATATPAATSLIHAFSVGGLAALHEPAAAFGAALARENPLLRVAAVAIGDRDEAGLVAALARETAALFGSGGWPQTGWAACWPSAGERLFRVFREIAPTASRSVREGAVYLLTGALGAIGKHIARRLAREGAQLALIGRAAPGPASEALIAEIRAAGGDALYLRADVTDFAQVEAAAAAARARFGRIDGVLHAAGTTRDKFLIHKSPEDFAAVLAPKLLGALALDRATAGDDLDLFVLFSSLAGSFGNEGQTDYAAANRFLDCFAATRRGPGRTLSIGWPFWREGGLSPGAEELARRLEGSGLRSLETEEALELFTRYAAGAEGAVLVLPAERETAEALLGAAPAPSERAGGMVDDTLAMLRSMLARATAMPQERIHPDRPLENYGIDSLLVSRMNGELAAIYPRVPKTLLFEHRTLRSAAAFLAERFGPVAPSREEAPPAAEATAPIEGIAIIGMAGRYPGADNLDAFWDNLCADRDLIVEIPPERWPVEGFYDPQIGAPGRSYSKWGGFLGGVDGFDPLFFSIAPGEAAAIDPNERLFLETCWEALEDAGHTRASLAPAPRAVGVYVGVMYGDYALLAADAAAPGRAVGGSAPYWSIANRVSYWFDLHGPSLAIDSACSSSLTAIHLACQALACGEIAVAISGGVNLSLHPLKYVGLSQGRFAASDGRCRSFTEGGDGYAPGEGVGAVILKPLAAALADGDHVHAVIRGWATNHGGKTNGYTVPDPKAQGAAITAALARAGVPAASVSYVEAHGTGTALGDPIEVAGLVAAFGEAGACALGSLKANIGHLEAAAGVAALTRVALQMRHRMLTPTRRHGATNPNIDFAATPFRLQHRLEPWTGPAPLRAGVSSFGAGGANAHLIVEAFAPAPAARADDAPGLFVLSARTEAQLRAYAERMAEFLRRTDIPFVDVCRTLQIGREPMAARLAFIARSGAEAAALLAAPKLVLVEEEGAAPPPPAHADLEALARAFLAGAPIDWRALALPGKRAPLPPHPFMRRRYWIEAPTRHADATLHPFLDALLPSLDGARFTKRFSPADAIVRDHRVQGRLLVPGVVQLEMARAAAERAGPPSDTLADIVWSTPLEVPDEGIDVTVTLRRTEQGARFEISGPAGETFCRGEIGAGARPVGTVDTAERAATRTLEAPGVFAALAALGLDYGPSLRRLTKIEISGDRLIARIDPPEAAPGVALPPDALDSALQALVGFADEAAERLFVPFSLARLARFGDLAHTRRILAERRAGGEGVISFDLSLCDDAGAVLARLEHLAARPRPARGVEPLQLTIRRPAWKAEPLGATMTAGTDVLLAHGGDDLGLAEAFGKDRVASWRWRNDPAVLPGLLAGRDLVWIAVGDPRHDLAAEAEAMALALLRAAQALDRAGRLGGGLRLFVVTRDLHGLTPRERPDPRAGAVVGLAKSLALEYPGLAVALIDVDAASLAALDPARLLGESALLPAQAVAWRRGVRHVEIMAPYEPPAPTPPIEPGAVVMIVGGAGGIGLALGAYLARECGARVALIGRRPFAEVAARLAAEETGLGELRYLEADATDRAAMDRAVAELRGIFGRIDAAIHAALVLRDRTIARMDEETFRAVLAPKLAGAVNLAEALAGENLRFLAFLSSVNVVSGSRGQANYVAGSSFVDAYAAALAAEKSWRVVTTDWGLWGEIGIVSGEAYLESLARQGVRPIRPAEGIEALASVLAGTEDRVALLRAEPAALLRLGLDREPAVGAAPIEAPFAALERYGRVVLCRLLGEMAAGAEGKAWTFEGLRRRLGVAERHKTLLTALLEALAQDALIESRDGLWRLAHETPDIETARRALDAAERGAPWLAGPRRLLQACLDAYPALLRGEVDPVAILFPEASMRLVEAAYADHPLADRFNRLVAAEVAAAAEASAAPLRVLEIGAGTGSTTAAVLNALTRPVDYLATDVSQRFASHGRARFGERPGLRFSILDIERDEDIEAAGVGFDIALAANVLHATADLAETLRRVKRLLRPGGRLLLSEATRASDFGTLVFGLTPGWWRAADRQSGRRIPFSPLCSVGAWRDLLAEAGFAAVRAIGAEEADAPHALLIAENEASAVRVDVAARLQDHLRRVLADVLKVDAEEIRLKESFDRYGLESLTALEVRNRLDPDFPGLPATLLFEQSTLARLADFLLSTHGERVARLFAAQPAAPAGAETAPLLAAPQRREAGEEPIAIIGFAGRYPGGPDPERFWELLRAGGSAIREVPPERWNADASFDPAGGEGRSYTKWAGFLDGDIGAFDPLFFSLSPLEAEAMDPQERLFLETAWTTLEQAGYAPDRLRRAAARPQGGDVGVFVGAMNVPYQWVAAEAVAAGHANAASTNFWSIANRISHLLDFSGPSLVVDTACSASLTAIHLACESLRRGECGAALAGGVNLILHPRQLVHLSQARMVSHGSECRAFGAGADGFVDGEGVGAVLLKPLEAAIRDGDRIEAVILGSAINSGGRSSGFTAPNPKAQAQVIRAALARAGVSPDTIDVVEAHGTGTALGDPIEIGALREVFAAHEGAPRAIGALKANIGHLESAAGIAGLTKLLLQLRHETIAPLRHAEEPNPLLALDDARLVLPAAPLPWPARETPRRAGVSSFGAGGANAHLVIEDHPASPRAAPRLGAELVVLSARDAERLRVMTTALVERLRSDPPRLDDVAHTLRVGRQAMDARLAVVAADVADLCARLSDWLAGAAESGVLFAAAPEASGARWSEGEEGRAEIARLLAAADLPELARRWVAGAEVDWSDLAGATDARLIELPSYPFRRERHWLPTPPAPEPRREKQAPPRSAEPARIELLTREWRPRPADRSGAARPVAVLAPDGALAAALAPLWPAPVYVLRPASAFAVIDARTIELNPHAPGDLEAALDHLAHRCPDGFAIVQASGLSKAVNKQDEALPPPPGGRSSAIGAREGVLPESRGFTPPRPASPADPPPEGEGSALNPARRAGAVTTLTLTQAAQRSGRGALRILHVFDEAEARPLDSAVGALALSAHQESRGVRLRAIGVAGAVEIAEAARICREELLAEDDAAEILREAGRRLHPVVAPAAPDEAEETIGFRVGGAYLLAGGLGEVGFALAERLGRDYRARIAILGRSDPRGAARERLERLEAQGVRVHYVACDLTDPARLRAALDEIESRIGRLHGVLHLARTVEDGLLAGKSPGSVERVLSAKVDGTLALDAALADAELDWFVLCSSLASWTGLPGGADYAFACGFQNAFARLRENKRRSGLRSGRTVAICWPQWEHDRFLDDAKRARLAAEGLETIDARDGLRILLDAVRSGCAEVAALKGGAEAIRRLTAAPAVEPGADILAELRELDEETLRAFLAYLDTPAAETRPAPPSEAAATLIREAICDFLKLPRDKLLPESAFADLGLDSIKALHLAERLQKRLGVAIDPVMFHESPTLARFSASVAARLARPDARVES